MANYYVLDNQGNPLPCLDMLTWGKFMDDINARRVAEDTLPDGTRISTVFIGINHNFIGRGEPILYETMIFDSGNESLDGYQRRYANKEKALIGHAIAVELAKTATYFAD